MFANAERMICPRLGQQRNEGGYQEAWILLYLVAWLLPHDIPIHLVSIEAQHGENPKEGSEVHSTVLTRPYLNDPLLIVVLPLCFHFS
jgi:hypothetical protein